MLRPGHTKKDLKLILLGYDVARLDVAALAAQFRQRISQYARIVLEDLQDSCDLGSVKADLAVVLGGDGSILRAARRLYGHDLPVLGVNLGRLGFLADVQPEQLEHALSLVQQGEYSLVDHILLQWELARGEASEHRGISVNEVAVMSGPPFRIQEIDLYVDGQLAASYSGDGLIVSTAIGSTAHNLSAGGPIVRKDLPVVAISAISPHTLTVRPVVDLARRQFELRVRQPNQSTSLVVDGQVVNVMTGDHRVRITQAQHVFRMVEIAGHNYFRTLREKLGWGRSFVETRSETGGSQDNSRG